jgi:flagellar biosynthesis chaperone FliJ
MAKVAYPLAQVLVIKHKRVEKAEQVVLEKKRLLEVEQQKLKEREAERDKVLTHRKDKLNQLREELDHGTTSDKILQMKAYLKVVDERVKVENKKVEDQKEQVKIANHNLNLAKEDLRHKRNEADKIETHKIDWKKEATREESRGEEKEMDEIGNVIYMLHQRNSKRAATESK